MDLQKLNFDKTAAQAGRWYSHTDGSRYLVAEAQVSGYAALLTNRVDYLQRRYGVGNIPEDEDSRILGECIAKKLVKGWEGVMNGDEEFECTEENRILLLTNIHPRVRELRNALQRFAINVEEWSNDAIQEGVEVLGKLLNSDSGS